MNNQLKTELKLFLAVALAQITGNEAFAYKLLNLDTRQRHILRERKKMTAGLWYRVLTKYNWICGKCRVRNGRNLDPRLPKMQVDHIVSLYNGGKTEWSNLQVLCGPCNRAKGVKTADYR